MTSRHFDIPPETMLFCAAASHAIVVPAPIAITVPAPIATHAPAASLPSFAARPAAGIFPTGALLAGDVSPVSYTHLTLPTILLV